MIDTAQKINRSTNRSTAGEGHVVRYGDVRRVRKVIVGCPASRTLRGQPPAQTSFPRTRESIRQPRRTETVRNRLTQKPTTKPLPKIPGRGANPRTEKSEKQTKGPKPPTKRAHYRYSRKAHVIPAKAGASAGGTPIQRKANLAASSAKGAPPSPAGRERAGVRARGGAGPDKRTPAQPSNN